VSTRRDFITLLGGAAADAFAHLAGDATLIVPDA
jgi:hypothetical protein